MVSGQDDPGPRPGQGEGAGRLPLQRLGRLVQQDVGEGVPRQLQPGQVPEHGPRSPPEPDTAQRRAVDTSAIASVKIPLLYKPVGNSW